MSQNYTPEEQAIIDGLRNLSRPELPAETVDSVRVKVIDALDLPPAPAPDSSTLPPMVWISIALLVAGSLLAGIALLPRQSATAPEPTITMAMDALNDTPTATATSTDAILGVHTPTLVSTDGILDVRTSTPTATSVPTDAPRRLVIEGPVSAIDGTRVTIYTTTITLRADDPVLATLSPGDRLRVVCVDDDGDPTVVTAVEFSIIMTIAAPAPPASSGSSSSSSSGSDDDDDDD
ncbi:MAG: hypothetical protein SF123_17735 [Chloroflexota bacterium]|nr:hypothetical protein [Chloroflexota bacterium]